MSSDPPAPCGASSVRSLTNRSSAKKPGGCGCLGTIIPVRFAGDCSFPTPCQVSAGVQRPPMNQRSYLWPVHGSIGVPAARTRRQRRRPESTGQSEVVHAAGRDLSAHGERLSEARMARRGRKTDHILFLFVERRQHPPPKENTAGTLRYASEPEFSSVCSGNNGNSF